MRIVKWHGRFATRFARADSRESFAIETPIVIARQADLPESRHQGVAQHINFIFPEPAETGTPTLSHYFLSRQSQQDPESSLQIKARLSAISMYKGLMGQPATLLLAELNQPGKTYNRFGLRNARPTTGIQNPGTPKFLEENEKILPKAGAQILQETLSKMLKTAGKYSKIVFSGSVLAFVKKFGVGRRRGITRSLLEEFRGSGVLDPCNWSDASQDLSTPGYRTVLGSC